MSGPAVVVEVAAAETSSKFLPALVSACTDGLRLPGGCALGDAESKSATPHAVAIISWSDRSHLTVHIEVGVRHVGQSEWRSRDLVFTERDQEEERWRATGLVIAAIVGEAQSANDVAEPGGAPPGPPAPSPTAAPSISTAPMSDSVTAAPPSPPSRWWMDASAILGRESFWTYGGRLQLTHALLGSMRARAGAIALVSGEYSAAASPPSNLSLDKMGAAFGVGSFQTGYDGRVIFELHVAARIERLHAQVLEPTSGKSDEGVEWLPAFCAGGSVAWMTTSTVGVALGAEVAQRTRGVVIRVLDQETARIPSLSWTLGAGIRLAL